MVGKFFTCVVKRSQENHHETDGKAVFFQGQMGTGKSYLLDLLRDKVEAEGWFAKVCATT